MRQFSACRSTHSCRWRASDGVTMVEVLISIFVFAVALLGLAATVTASLSALTTAQLRQTAYTDATRSIEVARTYAFEDLVLAAPADSRISADFFDPASGTIDAPGGTNEEALRRVDGATAATLPLEGELHQSDGRIRLRSFITVPDGQPDPPRQVRITVLAEFERGGNLQSVRQSTFISSDDLVVYGTEQPDFTLVPAVRGLLGERGSEVCVRHRLTNIGETADRYRIVTEGDGTGLELQPRAYEVGEGVDREIAVTPRTELPADDVCEWDSECTGLYQPAQPYELRICYDLDEGLETDPGRVELRVIAEASEPDQLDTASDQISHRIFHEIEVERDRHLYLTSAPSEASVVVDPMNPERADFALVRPEPVEDASVQPPEPLELPTGEVSRWLFEFDARRTLHGAQLDLWWSSETQSDEPQDGGDSSAEDQQLGFELHVIRHRDGDITDLFSAQDQPLSIQPEDGLEWSHEQLELCPSAPNTGNEDDWPACGTGGEQTPVMEPGDVIELRLRCVPLDPGSLDTGDEGRCRLAFGSHDRPSSLQLVFP